MTIATRVAGALQALAIGVEEWCDLTAPRVYMSDFFDQHRDEYIDGLFPVSARGAVGVDPVLS